MERSAAESVLATALRQGWVSFRDIDRRAVRFVDRSAGTGCVEVATESGRGFVVKFGFDRVGRAAVRWEGAAISRATRTGRGTALARALPRIHRFDRRAAWLVLKRVRGPGSLDLYAARGGSCPRASLEEAGRALAALHAVRRAPRRGSRGTSRPGRPPWPFSLAAPLPIDFLRRATPAAIELVRILQRFTELHEPIGSAAQAWVPSAWIHGDLRWENCLLQEGRVRRRLRIIDWERSGLGDPAWDLGAFFGEALRVWLFAGRIAPAHAPWMGEPAHTSRAALAAPAPLWDGYRRAGRRSPGSDGALLSKTVRFAAVWLLGRVFELSHTLPRWDPLCRRSVQVAANVFERPAEAARDLFGIEIPEAPGR